MRLPWVYGIKWKQREKAGHGTPEGRTRANPRANSPQIKIEFFYYFLWPAMQAHLPWQRPDDKEHSKQRPKILDLGFDVLYKTFNSISIRRLHKFVFIIERFNQSDAKPPWHPIPHPSNNRTNRETMKSKQDLAENTISQWTTISIVVPLCTEITPVEDRNGPKPTSNCRSGSDLRNYTNKTTDLDLHTKASKP